MYSYVSNLNSQWNRKVITLKHNDLQTNEYNVLQAAAHNIVQSIGTHTKFCIDMYVYIYIYTYEYVQEARACQAHTKLSQCDPN